MPNLKISQLTAGDPAQSSDLIPVARSGANYGVTAASVAALSNPTTVTTTISSSQILNLTTTPVQIIPGTAGYGIQVLNAVLTYIPNTTPYADPIAALQGSSISSVASPTLSSAGTFTSCAPMGSAAPSYSGLVKYTGTLTAQPVGYVTISGFSSSGNNGVFPVVNSNWGSGNTYILVINPNAVAETHSGTLQNAAAVYTGNNSGSHVTASGWYYVNGLSNNANCGWQYCTAANSTTMTFANSNAVPETHAGITNGGSGQQFILYSPSVPQALGYMYGFATWSANVGMSMNVPQWGVLPLVGSMNPAVAFAQVYSLNAYSIPNAVDGQGLYFSLGWSSGNGFPYFSVLPTTFTPLQNLTSGDGQLELSCTYLLVPTS